MVNSLLAVDGRTEETAEELQRLVMGLQSVSSCGGTGGAVALRDVTRALGSQRPLNGWPP